MRTKLLTLSACAVLLTGCSTINHQPEINTEGIDSIYVYTGMPRNNVESDIYRPQHIFSTLIANSWHSNLSLWHTSV